MTQPVDACLRLAACPFCGGEASAGGYESCDCCGAAYNGYVNCECGASVSHLLSTTAAIAAWNRRAPALQAAMQGWLPIESAPVPNRGDHGTMLLGLVDGDVRFIQWGKTSHVPLYGWCLADQGVEDFDLCKPTHWMPLPTPPTAAEPGEA
jgi:uncharacterized protein DUF551